MQEYDDNNANAPVPIGPNAKHPEIAICCSGNLCTAILKNKIVKIENAGNTEIPKSI